MTVNIEGLGKITASKDVLNTIAGAFRYSGELQHIKNRDALANYHGEVFNSIYDALDESGYYND